MSSSKKSNSNTDAARAAATKLYKQQTLVLGKRYAELSNDARDYRATRTVIDFMDSLDNPSAGADVAIRAIFGAHYKLTDRSSYLRFGRFSAHKLTIVADTPVDLPALSDGPMPMATLVLPLSDSLLEEVGVDTTKMMPEDFLVSFGTIRHHEVVSASKLRAFEERAKAWLSGLRRAFPRPGFRVTEPYTVPRTAAEELRELDFPWNSFNRVKVSCQRIAAYAAQRQKVVEERIKREQESSSSDDEEDGSGDGSSSSDSDIDTSKLRDLIARARTKGATHSRSNKLLNQLEALLAGSTGGELKRAGEKRVTAKKPRTPPAKRARDDSDGASSVQASRPAKSARAAAPGRPSATPSNGSSGSSSLTFVTAEEDDGHSRMEDATTNASNTDGEAMQEDEDNEERDFQIALRLSRINDKDKKTVASGEVADDETCRMCHTNPAVVFQECDVILKRGDLPFHKTFCMECWNDPAVVAKHRKTCFHPHCQQPVRNAHRIENGRLIKMPL